MCQKQRTKGGKKKEVLAECAYGTKAAAVPPLSDGISIVLSSFSTPHWAAKQIYKTSVGGCGAE
jgi:hypothetical protein